MKRLSLLLTLVAVLMCSCEGPVKPVKQTEKPTVEVNPLVRIEFPSLPLPQWSRSFGLEASEPPYRNLEQISFAKDVLDLHPDIDPAGGYLVFTRIEKGRKPGIWIKKVHGYASRLLTRAGVSAAWPIFSPDGKEVAFAMNRNGNWDIFTIPLSQPNALRQVTMSGAHEIAPAWSPDGRNIIYCALLNGKWEMTIINLDSMNQLWIGAGLFPVWSPDGSKMAYMKPREGGGLKYSIWTMDIEYDSERHMALSTGSPTKVVSADEFSACMPGWSPDGTRLTFMAVPHELVKGTPPTALIGRDIWTVKSDGTELVNLTSSDAYCWDPVWTEDVSGRQRIVFASQRQGGQNIWSVEPGRE